MTQTKAANMSSITMYKKYCVRSVLLKTAGDTRYKIQVTQIEKSDWETLYNARLTGKFFVASKYRNGYKIQSVNLSAIDAKIWADHVQNMNKRLEVSIWRIDDAV